MKRMVSKLSVVAVAFALAVSGGGVLATGSTVAQPTAIDSCTVISEPGEYVLTQDVASSGEGTCIEIRASDVVVDGNGYAIEGQGDGTGIGTPGTEPVQNVTVANLVVREHETNVRLDDVTDGQLTDVRSQDPDMVGAGLVVSSAEQIEITNSQLDGASFGGAAVQLRDSAEVTVANNSFTEGSQAIDAEGLDRSVVSGNEFSGGHPIQLDSGSENTISNNVFDGRPQVPSTSAGTTTLCAITRSASRPTASRSLGPRTRYPTTTSTGSSSGPPRSRAITTPSCGTTSAAAKACRGVAARFRSGAPITRSPRTRSAVSTACTSRT